MKIGIFYFSATGNTKLIAEVIKKELTQFAEVDDYNLISSTERQKIFNTDEYDAFIFGFPIYAWRAPRLIREWLTTLDGKGKKCATFFTYGGISSGASHFTTKKILESHNFKFIAASEYIGKHTYNLAGWNLFVDRPNESDFVIARKFANLIFERFNQEDQIAIEIEDPHLSDRKLDQLEKMADKAVGAPSRNGEECSMCLKCEEECPTNAMDAEAGNADPSKCIKCLNCLISCPDNALKMGDMSKHQDFILKANNLTEEILNNRQSKIIS